MPRTVVRNLLPCVTPAPLLAFVGPALLEAPATPAASAAPHVVQSPAPVSGAIRHPGLAGPDRLTPAQGVWRPAPGGLAPAPPLLVGGTARQEFSWINQDRAANGSRALAWSAPLARVAQYRAQGMLNRHYFSHDNPATGQLAFVEPGASPT